MRKILFLLCLLVVFSCSSSGSLPRRIDTFVDRAEASAEKMSLEEWEITTEQFEGLLEEFAENYEYYTADERREVFEAIGRYNGLLLKSGLEEFSAMANDLKEDIDDFLEELPGALNGLIDGFISAFKDETK